MIGKVMNSGDSRFTSWGKVILICLGLGFALTTASHAQEILAPERPELSPQTDIAIAPGDPYQAEASDVQDGTEVGGEDSDILTELPPETVVIERTRRGRGDGRRGNRGGRRNRATATLTSETVDSQAAPITALAISSEDLSTQRALILYDSVPTSTFGKLGMAYAIMLRNLLGHFDLAAVDLKPVDQYSPGDVESYYATFYLGSFFANPVPADFLNDVSTTQQIVVWFKYNIWQMAWDPAFNFTQVYGFSFDGLRGLNASPNAGNPEPGFFDTVDYKGQSLVKHYAFNVETGTVFADPDVGATSIVDPNLAENVVPISNPVTAEQIPYIARSQNFWYFADIPFSYIGRRDRYLVICDILHDILDVDDHVEEHRALVRFEDVGALVSPSTMQQLSDFLFQESIPFSIATIPFYRDPFGTFNGGVPQEIHLADATNLLSSLDYATARGGKIVMHGYTHQYNSLLNPWSAISGDDFEFWNIVENRPVDEDSEAWVLDRLDNGLAEFADVGITPFAWETPHYHASAIANRTFPQRFDTTYQRAVYYTADNPNFDPNAPNRDFWVGQFFPYIIASDYYGQRILPENIGNIEYDISHIDPSSNIDNPWHVIAGHADYGLIVRDGFASFFFHPFWLEPSLGVPGFADFQSLVNAITALNYTWVDASEL